jgi:hypothetical protein
MDKIKQLEIKKLFKELDYVQSDFDYRNEVISDADNTFLTGVNEFLENNPDLKELYNNKINEVIEKNITENSEEPIEEEEEEEDTKDVKSSKIKKLYREIVKLTHPDKTDNKKLNEYYIQGTECYNDNDKIGMYIICGELNIEYEMDDDDNTHIKTKIDVLKGKIDFIESTFTYKWAGLETEEEKIELIKSFILMKIQ